MSGPLRVRVSDDVELEARWDVPEVPAAAIVFCHPHPQAQGTMTVPLMAKVTEALVGRGLAVLRFNFRGVGRSTGTWGGGLGEVDDVHAAVTEAAQTYEALPRGLAGWSFGAATSLQWQAREASTMPWVGIAPPVVRDGVDRLPAPAALAAADRTFIVGDRDQFVTVEQIEKYASQIGASVQVLSGSDHFFFFREDRVADAVTAALCAACLPRDQRDSNS